MANGADKVIVSAYVPRAVHAELLRLAATKGRSLSAEIGEALHQHTKPSIRKGATA
jgi:hypothetical protein